MRAQIGTLIIATSVIQLANGFFGTFISLRVATEDFGATLAGLVLSSYFAGFTLGAVRCGQIIELGAALILALVAAAGGFGDGGASASATAFRDSGAAGRTARPQSARLFRCRPLAGLALQEVLLAQLRPTLPVRR